MADERMIQRLEEQLRDAHATNAELREDRQRLEDLGKNSSALSVELSRTRKAFNEVVAAKDAAEKNAAAAQREAKEAESARLSAEEKVERLEGALGHVRAEAERLSELNARVEQAKSIHDLVG